MFRQVVVSFALWVLLSTNVVHSEHGHCCDECDKFLVTGVDGVDDGKLTASAEFNGFSDGGLKHRASRARLTSTEYTDNRGVTHSGAWSAGWNNANQWIQVEFASLKLVRGVITRGRSPVAYRLAQQWVTAYNISYSVYGNDWHAFDSNQIIDGQMVWPGNFDQDSPVINRFPLGFYARVVRLHPVTWNHFPSMRFDVIGCDGIVR